MLRMMNEVDEQIAREVRDQDSDWNSHALCCGEVIEALRSGIRVVE